MPHFDLKTKDGLVAAIDFIRSDDQYTIRREEWAGRLAKDISRVRDADEAELSTFEFQQMLWEGNNVSDIGMGTVKIEGALRDEGFRKWVAARSLDPLPENRAARPAALRERFFELIKRLATFADRNAHLKVYRVLAILYPGELTTLASLSKLHQLADAMGAPRGGHPIDRHAFILSRLRDAIGEPEAGDEGMALWLGLPWHICARVIEAEKMEPTIAATDPGDKENLIPLSAARRQRGMHSIAGGLPLIIGTLEVVRDGATRDELLDHLRSEYPNYKDNSLGNVVNMLRRTFDVIELVDGRYVPTQRGETLLESEDPDDLSDWLLTHILGLDTGLVRLRDGGPMSHGDWLEVIQAANPGWATLVTPSAIGSWLRSLGTVEKIDGVVSLTNTGRAWAEQIHWTPEALPKPEDVVEDQIASAEIAEQGRLVQLPTFADIYGRVSGAGHFEDQLVAELHAGLWAHPRRHFGILTGLSGSGKTLLAREYAKAIAPQNAPAGKHLCTIAVQPAWYDPGALLGYVNPLRGDSYFRTRFLEFLIAASNDPGHPYVAVLDEMNLSHPEQYLAPLLSAMETGARVILHSEGDLFDGIPASVPYPSNLVIIGTVNMDETTHGLSDKILDRAFTMEFWDIDLDTYPRWGARDLAEDDEAKARGALDALMTALKPARLHFGWRVVDDVLDFLNAANADGVPLTTEVALDRVIYAKVLPKLRGDDSPRFKDALRDVIAALGTHGLTTSKAKVEELKRDLDATGTARFWR
jgi:5-methylcytosine-specific restriction protein B